MSMVESLNRTLGRLLNGYMNRKEVETGKVYKEWTDVLPVVREELNKIRLQKTNDNPVDDKDVVPDISKPPKFKEGDIVFRLLDAPETALGAKQSTTNFREGDRRWDKVPRKIERVLVYSGAIPYRYMLSGIPNASYTEAQLMIAKGETQEKFKVKEIIGKRTRNKKIEYQVWWLGYPKAEATFEPKQNLIEDGFEDEIKEFEKRHNRL